MGKYCAGHGKKPPRSERAGRRRQCLTGATTSLGLRAYASEPFVETARAKGLSDWRTGWHLFRNTAVTLLSVLLTNMYGTVLVAVFAVEFATKTPGIGTLIARATVEGDLVLVLGLTVVLALVLGLTVVLALVGVVTTFAQDLAYAFTDPRVEFDE